MQDTTLLPEQIPAAFGRKTLIIDLDETLVHSLFQPTTNSDLVWKVNFNGNAYKVYVRVRPGTAQFLKVMSEIYEVVIFTASL